MVLILNKLWSICNTYMLVVKRCQVCQVIQRGNVYIIGRMHINSLVNTVTSVPILYILTLSYPMHVFSNSLYIFPGAI